MTRMALALAIPLMMILAAPAFAQYRTSTISGTVLTGGGLPIAGTRIEWTQDGQTVSIASDAEALLDPLHVRMIGVHAAVHDRHANAPASVFVEIHDHWSGKPGRSGKSGG